MTVRRRNDDGDEVQVTVSRKLIYGVVALIASGTPPGQAFLAICGLKSPAAQEVNDVQKTADSIRTDIALVKSDVASLKSDVAAVKTKQDNFEIRFTGFQIDFDKYKTKTPL